MVRFAVKIIGDIKGKAFDEDFKVKAPSSDEAMEWAAKQAKHLGVENLVVKVDELPEETA